MHFMAESVYSLWVIAQHYALKTGTMHRPFEVGSEYLTTQLMCSKH